jgi:hypothetical protein
MPIQPSFKQASHTHMPQNEKRVVEIINQKANKILNYISIFVLFSNC